MWENPTMTTVVADDKKRVRIPSAKPGQVFALDTASDGALTLTPIKTEHKEAFPPGSLKKYVTAENDRELLQILKGCTLEGPE